METLEKLETTAIPRVSTAANYNNETFNVLDDLQMDSNFVWLLCSLIFGISWIMYITFYNSRVTGYIITRAVNRLFIGDGFFKTGSLTLNVLSGKIMFRDVVYITHDYSVRVQDGYLIFRWWRSYVPKDVSEDLSHSDTRLSVVLNGFELHVYNRSELYSQLEHTFGLQPAMFQGDDGSAGPGAAQGKPTDAALNDENAEGAVVPRQRPEAAMARTWRDLIPVIKMDVSSSRIVFGNRLLPTSLSLTVEESHFVYSTKPAACTLDKLMHFCKCWAENARVMLVPSPKYTGMLDEPPRYMGEGFVLMATNYLELYMYMDEPGLVPEEPVLVQLANGDIVESSPPMWGVDIKCGRGTDFSYGPWADRQREHLFRFFFPADYRPMQVTCAPRPGDRRQMHTFDIRLSMLNEATIDVLFTKERETSAVHVNVGAGSYLEATLPWIILQDGTTTRVTGQLLHLEATTSLQYREFVVSETLEFAVSCHYPLIWNHCQQWELNLTGCKATIALTYAHKIFFQDLLDDWACKRRPDLMHFVPYKWRFGLTLKHCEIPIACNPYNWMDCSSAGQRRGAENARLALCAHLFHLSFELPFDQFLPETVPLTISIQAESVDLSLFVPEVNTTRGLLLALDKCARLLSTEGRAPRQRTENIPKWRNVCQHATGWIDFWWIPIGAVSIQWVYHPVPPLGPRPQADISTPVKEELLLSPMRFPHRRKPTPTSRRSPENVVRFDPTTLTPDSVSIDLEIGPSVLILYGTVLGHFLHLKENLFGDDQVFTDLSSQAEDEDCAVSSVDDARDESLELDVRYFRPLDVDVSVIMHDIQAHLPVGCATTGPSCPVLLIERFGFEMRKRYEQTELQLLLSPSVLLVFDTAVRTPQDTRLSNGRIALSSLQIRGHAMFSDRDTALGDDTIEYAWLVELQLGKLSTKITAPQLHQLITCLETLTLLASDSENELSTPRSKLIHQIDNPTPTPVPPTVVLARQSVPNTGQTNSTLQAFIHTRQMAKQAKTAPIMTAQTNKVGPKQADPPVTTKSSGGRTHQAKCAETQTDVDFVPQKLKYKFVRVGVDAIDFWLVEAGTALQCWISPVRVASCNLHGRQVGSGLSCVVYNAMLRQLLRQPNYRRNTVTAPDTDPDWLEVGSVHLGTLVVESVMSLAGSEQLAPMLQNRFLKMHDERTKRLWFLWSDTERAGRCGCVGGCTFFGSNRNGPRFFRPTASDLADGINVASFRVNETGRDLGYGQSLLHDGHLVFRTPPYTGQDVCLQGDVTAAVHTTAEPEMKVPSPVVGSKGRRFSYSMEKSDAKRDVPYALLVDQQLSAPISGATVDNLLPAKLDSDSKLHTERGVSTLSVPGTESGPKNSLSDSKLAVDYFNTNVVAAVVTAVKENEQISARIVNISESHHSLCAPLDSEERLRQEVQRTISMSSENQSEAFFSADEELNPSRTSSLRHSIIGSGTVLNQTEAATHRKKFASDLSIVADRRATGVTTEREYTGGGGSGPNSLTECAHARLSSHRSDHEIHTPEHRSLAGHRPVELLDEERRAVQGGLATPRRKVSMCTQRSISPRLPEALDELNGTSTSCDSSETRSLSSNSYVSAVCSQEDVTLVDLHVQAGRQIVDSPMLMSSYVSHLAQARCANWSTPIKPTVGTGCDAFSTPMFERATDGKLMYVGGTFVPRVHFITEGFTLLKLVSRGVTGKRDGTSPAGLARAATASTDGRGVADIPAEGDATSNIENDDEELLVNRTDAGSRVALIVRVRGDLDVTVTPLVLECLQRFVDALTPVLATDHPLNVLSHLHASCVSQVESANTLKKDGNVASRLNAVGGRVDYRASVPDPATELSATYEEFMRTQLQATVSLPRINITLLQASVVEDVISFSALDNVRDLTCVSLLTVCLDGVAVRFHSGRQTREVVHTYQRPTVVQAGGKKGMKGPKAFLTHLQSTASAAAADTVAGEPVFIETSERQQEETVISLSVGRAHTQLRRLRNESSILNDAVITAIPVQHSRVLFECTRSARAVHGVEYYWVSGGLHPPPAHFDELSAEDKLGFIMFEGGLEGVSIKVVKRSQYERPENEENTSAPCAETVTDSARSGQDVDSIDKQSEASTQTTVTSQRPVINSSKTEHAASTDLVSKDNGNTSSCVIDLRAVWFNFAAPPRAPITRKLDYTRLDWNLLSTASPAINAWMNPSNRFAIRLVHMLRARCRRRTGVAACLMAEALDVQAIHMPIKSRYCKLTPLAKTLQEDPSCQLCGVLEKYILRAESTVLETSLREPLLPPLSTLRQGVIVLSRQWKNVLYTPLLLDHNYKARCATRPVNVTFAVPRHHDEEACLTDGEASGNEEPDVTDECAMLLHTEALLKATGTQDGLTNEQPVSVNGAKGGIAAGNAAGNALAPPHVAIISEGIESVLTSPSPPSVPHRRQRRGLQPTQNPSSSRASVVFPILAAGNPFTRKPHDDSISYGTLREDKVGTVAPGSDPSVYSQSSPELPSSPLHRPRDGEPPPAPNAGGSLPACTRTASCEDLYSWMAKQQEYVHGATHGYDTTVTVTAAPDSRVNTLATDSSGEAGPAGVAGVSLYPMQDSLRLLDAHLIFQPLLSSLGVVPHQMVGPSAGAGMSGESVGPGEGGTSVDGAVQYHAPASSLDSLGSNLSLVGTMEQMRIDIVVSEHGKDDSKRRTSGSRTHGQRPHLEITPPDESPAFACERVSVELQVDKVADMTVDDMIRTRNVLYISRGQLKKHTSTALNFSVGVRQISQRVNMPLLRLLHQITNMYQNVKDAQNELKMGTRVPVHATVTVHDPGHTATATTANNNSSSASDLQEITLVEGSRQVTAPRISSVLPDAPSGLLISPSPSVRSRPQSFAQKLRSTGKSVRGYMNLSEGAGTPMLAESPSTCGDPITGSEAGACWKTVYHLLDLYATMPETKTITHRFSMTADMSEQYRAREPLVDARSTEDGPVAAPLHSTGERTRLVVFGVARIHRTRLLATLSGLKLEAEITSLHSSLTWRKKSRPASLEFSLTGQVGRTMIVLLEGVAPNQQTVVRVTVGKSQALYSSITRRTKDKNSGLLTVGAVNIDIPQHPVALHGMVTRGSKQLSSTLQELRVTRTASRLSRTGAAGQTADIDENCVAQHSPHHIPAAGHESTRIGEEAPSAATASVTVRSTDTGAAPSLLQPLVMQFSIILQSLSITAALLPSLQAQYKMDQVNSTGVTGSRAKFTVDLPLHSLSFTTRLSAAEANLPSEASISLPAVHVSAEHVPEGATTEPPPPPGNAGAEGLVLRKGGYLAAHADIGVFEHSLTTDLLNHLVFVQKVFMKEVNEVVQKVYGGERPVRLWSEDATDDATATSSAWSRVLFSLVIRIQRVQLTATTAGSSAVRLETGAVALELSNRVQNVCGAGGPRAPRLFGKAQVDINLCLGQLSRNPMFEEAEPDFQQFAFFNTRICLRNAFQEEMVDGENKEVVLITLRRPLIYVQPLAVDRAILVWLNYKNAYDYWNEKRANLNKEVLTATQQVFERVQLGSQLSAATHLGTLFLQLTVDDMGICLPLNPPPQMPPCVEESRGAVVVTLESTSIAACSSGSLVSKGRFANLCLRFADDFDPSLDDWKPDMSDAAGTAMNLCVVSEGTYEVCSRTVTATGAGSAKWFLNVQWQMEGVDIGLDVNVGKQLSALGHTLTMLAGAEDGPTRSGGIAGACPVGADDTTRSPSSSGRGGDDLCRDHYDLDDDDDASDTTRSRCSRAESRESVGGSGIDSLALPAFLFDPSLDARKRSRLIEKEMSEQAKIINDLRSLGASHGTIEHEMRRLHELEALVFKDFRRDMMQRLRRQSVKASSIRGKLGLGPGTSGTYRSKSFAAPGPSLERQRAVTIPVGSSSGVPVTDRDSLESNTLGLASNDSSPRTGPSRAASLREPRVTFGDTAGISPATDHHMEIDGERVELRRRTLLYTDVSECSLSPSPPQNMSASWSPRLSTSQTATQQQSTSTTHKPHEPNIDFELDVKVLINSGKCVLHTKDQSREEELRTYRMRKDRSSSTGLLEFPPTVSSPDATRRHRDRSGQASGMTGPSTRYRGTQAHSSQLIDLTIFHIPGMDVKLHYESKVVYENSDISASPPSPATAVFDTSAGFDNAAFRDDDDEETPVLEAPDTNVPRSASIGISNPNYSSSPTSPLIDKSTASNPWQEQSVMDGEDMQRKIGVKKASLFAWMTLQSIPEETIISPHILEFLEQTLEPIPTRTASVNTTTSSSQSPAAAMASTFTDSGHGDTATDLSSYGTYVVYTSFPVDVIVYFHMQPSTFRFSCLPVSRVECILQLPSLDIVFSSKRAEEELTAPPVTITVPPDPVTTAVGGLSVTGCLADFSVYIFHPYGGGKKASGGTSARESQRSPLSDVDRKDSLSINVEFVKFHLSRLRKLNLRTETETVNQQRPRAIVRFSTIVDIGSASFKYDMRRLTEILAFPKAWYRRSIVRRLFLGDPSGAPASGREGAAAFSSNLDGPIPEEEPMKPTPQQLSKSAPARERLRLLNIESEPTWHSTPSGSEPTLISSAAKPARESTTENTDPAAAWETLVLFAVNFTKLNVHMNMGNVMGNVSWHTRDFRSEGRLSIGSSGHKNMYVAFGLAGSGLDAKGGIVGGTIEIAHIDTHVHIREEPAAEPDHTLGLQLHALELRLDYMGTSVLMCRVSALDATLRDEWKVTSAAGSTTASAIPTRRPATVFIHGVLGWDQLQLMISKSSTADLIKMYHKLDEFFGQQFNSSKRVFSRLGPVRPAPRVHLRVNSTTNSGTMTAANITAADARHHRHWQRALSQVAGLKLSATHRPLPPAGTILGGTIELRGQNISLACFHGINFKSKSWALFSLREPCINFNTEAQEVPGTSVGAGQDVHIVQTLTCSLGLNTYSKTQHSMATVCRVSRNVVFPPQFRTLQEWFHYAFANSTIDEVDKFPSLERDYPGASTERVRTSTTPKLQDPNHTRETIFALPSLQLHLKTEHLQTATTPDGTSCDKPIVDCSFVTEFEDHIFVTVDAEAFFFLHDLITSYLREKERVFTSANVARSNSPDPERLRTMSTSTSSGSEEERKKAMDAMDLFTKDWRSYQCKTWHLEPTVRLLSWAGKSIEPYGIDYILQKLGFSHARTTIPKWMQRGFMDPLDKVLALLTMRMVTVIKEEKAATSNRQQQQQPLPKKY